MASEPDTVPTSSSPEPKVMDLADLKTAPSLVGRLITQDTTPKTLRRMLTILMVFLGSYFDLEYNARREDNILTSAVDGKNTGSVRTRIGSHEGKIFISIEFPGYWLDFDASRRPTIKEVEKT